MCVCVCVCVCVCILHSTFFPQSEMQVFPSSSDKLPTSTAASVAQATDQPPNTQALTSSQSATNTVSMLPSNCGQSDSQAAPTGMELGQTTVTGDKRKAPQSLFQKKEHSSSGISSDENASQSASADFLEPLFTNWPCIVATVLGYCPLGPSSNGSSGMQQGDQKIRQLGDPLQNWPSQSKGMSSVQSLDSFTMHLILNCSEICIKNFTTTIVDKINSCLAESSQCSVDILDINIHDIDLKSIDESILPILVGKRFLNSVIRVLGMEHSRVKNTFVEMQQLRGRGGGEGGGGGGGGGRERGRRGLGRGTERERPNSSQPLKNVVKIAKLVLHHVYLS